MKYEYYRDGMGKGYNFTYHAVQPKGWEWYKIKGIQFCIPSCYINTIGISNVKASESPFS